MDPGGRYEATYRVKAARKDAYKWLSGRGNVQRCDDGAFLLYVFFSDVNDKTELSLEKEKESNRNEILLSQIMTKGAEVLIRKVAPLGDPIELNVRGYELSVRKADAELIEIE